MDNSTAHLSSIYDREVVSAIPYYRSFHSESLLFLRSMNLHPERWLDTGCGTGTFAALAAKEFPQTKFYLAEPSIGMLDKAKEKFSQHGAEVQFIQAGTLSLDLKEKSFDVITAILSHHYFSKLERKKATALCCRLLRKNSIFITFENIRPSSKKAVELFREYWKQSQILSGRSEEEAELHRARFMKDYFPITVDDHIALYKQCGFRNVELFWKSYMQAGFICVR